MEGKKMDIELLLRKHKIHFVIFMLCLWFPMEGNNNPIVDFSLINETDILRCNIIIY